MLKEKTKSYLINRIEELIKKDSEVCLIRWDRTKTDQERRSARAISNNVTFARQQLQSALKEIDNVDGYIAQRSEELKQAYDQFDQELKKPNISTLEASLFQEHKIEILFALKEFILVSEFIRTTKQNG